MSKNKHSTSYLALHLWRFLPQISSDNFVGDEGIKEFAFQSRPYTFYLFTSASYGDYTFSGMCRHFF